jgi:hypothetical protein
MSILNKGMNKPSIKPFGFKYSFYEDNHCSIDNELIILIINNYKTFNYFN